jgi:hypothetical protein
MHARQIMDPNITLRSTLDSRAYWRDEAARCGTDWRSLHQQHSEAWRLLRSLAEPFATGLSSFAPGLRP